MNVKLVLYNVDRSGEEGHPPLGLAYLASYLKEKIGFDNIIIVDKVTNPIKSILKQNPDIIGISSCTSEFEKAKQIAREIKIRKNIPIILGGPHITVLPNLLTNSFDIGVIGEGEETLKEIMENFLKNKKLELKWLKKIKGICYHANNEIKINKRRELIKNLDSIPLPNRDLFDMEGYYLKPRRAGATAKLSRATHIITSRGCPYRCVFCASSAFWKGIRFSSAERVVEEIKLLVKKYKVEEIAILDDLFPADLERLRKIVELLEENNLLGKIKFAALTRVNLMDDERCALLKKMDVTILSLGFESQSQKVLSYLKNNTTTIEQNQKAMEIAKRYGFDVSGFFMIGAPNETKEDMLKTLHFIKSNPMISAGVCTVTPYPGTVLWEYAKSRGLVSDNMNWEKLNLHPTNKDFILLDEEMNRKEFFKIYSLFMKETEKRGYKIKFEMSKLLSVFMIKKVLRNPSQALKYFYYSFIKR